MGVGHLPRLAQNELVLRLANHGLVLLGHLLYGLAELHKLCLYQLWSSACRTTDGLSEQLQACCIGGRVHRKTSPKFFEPGLSLKHNCDLSVIMAEVSIGVSSVIPMALLVQQLYCTAAQLLQEIDQHLSLLVQGLVKARSDAVDGDGAATRLNAFVPWTPELQAAVVMQSSLYSLTPATDFQLNTTQLTGRCTSRESPFRLCTVSPGTETPTKPWLLMTLTHKCADCGHLNTGNDQNDDSCEITCSACGNISPSTREWAANTNHKLVGDAIARMEFEALRDSRVVRQLNFDILSPVKAARSKYGSLRSDSRLIQLTTCMQCNNPQPPMSPSILSCSACGGLLQPGSTVYTIDPTAVLDTTLFQQLRIAAPNRLQLLFGNLNLTPDQLLAQQELSLTRQFPTWPMVEYIEVTSATQVGVLIGTGSFAGKLLKSVLTAVEAVSNAISDKEGLYQKMQYLELKTATRLKTRYAQQEALLRALIDSNLIQLLNAALAGQLLIMNDPDDKSGTSIMATTQNANFVKELIDIPNDWAHCLRTALHDHLEEAQTASPNTALTISPVSLSQLNPAALRMVIKMLPDKFLASLKLKHRSLEYGEMSWIKLIVVALREYQFSSAISAELDREDLELALSAPMRADENATAFRHRYTRNLERFAKCSGTRRFTDSLRGVNETIEHILTAIGKGTLRTAVMSKLESARCKAALRHEPPPDLDKFWSIFAYQSALFETNSARDLSMASAAKRKREQIGETINSLSTESEGHVEKCRHFMRTGQCDFGAKCRFSHEKVDAQSHAKPSVTNVERTGRGKGKGKGSGKIGNGGKGATKPDVPTYYDRAIANFCSRCNRDHKGGIGTDCAMSPCRFCVSEGHADSDHHLRYCELKPDDWKLSSTLPIASKRQLSLTASEKPANDKKRKLTALELVQTLSETELAEVSAAINTIHNGPEVSATTSSDDVQEAIQALISFNRRKPSSVDKPAESNSQPDGTSTTQLVPFASKKAASITAVRHAPPPDQEEQLRKIALAKVNAAKGHGHRHGMYSLVIEDAKPEKRRLFATNEEFFSNG